MPPTSQILYKQNQKTFDKPNHGFSKSKPIDLSDLQRIQSYLKGNANEAHSQQLKQDKIHLHQISKERVRQWENTVHGQRRKRLYAREKRAEEEEKKRVENDLAHSKYVQEQRMASIRRAEELMYNEQDNVKQFHSRLLMHQILKERDLQIQLNVKKKTEQQSNRLLPMDVIIFPNDLPTQIHEKKVESALAQKDQWTRMVNDKCHQKKKELEEGKELIQKDKEQYEIERKKRESNKKDQQKAFRESLELLQKEKWENKLWQKKEDEENEKRAKAWNLHKEKIMKHKKQIEEERFNDALRIRQEIGARQKLTFEPRYQPDDSIERAQRENDLKFQSQQKLKKENQQKEMRAIEQYRQQKISDHEQQKRAEEEVSRSILAAAFQEARQLEKDTAEKWKNERNIRLKLQQSHQNQMQVHNQKKKDEIKYTNDFHELCMKRELDSEAHLKQYIASIPGEQWVGNKDEMKSFVQNELEWIDISKGSKGKGNIQLTLEETFHRLGFGNGDLGCQKEPIIGLLSSKP